VARRLENQLDHKGDGGSMKIVYCSWKGWRKYIFPHVTDSLNVLNRKVVFWLCWMIYP